MILRTFLACVVCRALFDWTEPGHPRPAICDGCTTTGWTPKKWLDELARRAYADR